MTIQGEAAKLYTPEILALAVELAEYPLTTGFDRHGEARSRLCGSRVSVGITTTPEGAVARVGAQVTACAVGQAAAALYLRSACGRGVKEHAATLHALEGWLDGGHPQPDWPDLRLLAPAIVHPARHGAILLPWKAAMEALSNARPAG